MKKIRDLFQKDIRRKIEEVIKVSPDVFCHLIRTIIMGVFSH
jgi:hypothetical protein